MKKIIGIGTSLTYLSLFAPIITNATIKTTPIYNSNGKTNRILITQPSTGGNPIPRPTSKLSLPNKGLGSSGGVAKRINSIINQNGNNSSILLNNRGIRN